ncbi:MAG: DUF885 domain-containing protein [Phycisphaerales bacterium]|nr:DUF885 domain-containing protein [Phycisphaerales bacterium]
MVNHRVLAIILGAMLAASGLARAQSMPSANGPSSVLDISGAWRSGRSAELLAILDDHVEQTLREDPLEASQRGDDRFADQLADLSAEAVKRSLELRRARLAKLNALGNAKLSEVDRLDADLLRYELETDIERAKVFGEQMPIDARSGPQVWLPQMHDSLSFSSEQDYRNHAARLEKVAAQIDQTIAQMRAGLAAGRVPPKVVMVGTVDQCRMLSSADVRETPSLSRFYAPFLGRPASDPAATRARAAIRDGIVPAFERLGRFLQDEYLPKCRDSVAYSAGIDGPAAYDAALRRHTTLAMSADQIHQLGLSEVARIKGEMMGVIARTDYPRKSELAGDELFRAFIEYLRTDPRFYYTKPEDLLAGYREISKRIDAEMPKLFTVLPRLPYGVRELPALTAPTSPTAYYYRGSIEAGAPGWFMCNTYKLDQRPKYEMIALTLHEAVPGHHHQIAIAQELKGQHPFRTFGGYTAFVEGWALYSERLGLEVGDGGGPANTISGSGMGSSEGPRHLYSDPYDDFGRLSYEMWRASRLVVDTGIHAKGWSRAQAIEYMLSVTSLSPLNIEREVDRYIAWPGQACAYKIGELKIRELRARAEKALGAKFDRRTFHDAILDSGAVPLPTLEAKMDRWMTNRN